MSFIARFITMPLNFLPSIAEPRFTRPLMMSVKHMNRLILVLLAFPVSALAEVSDKMPTQSGLWVSGVAVGGFLTFAIRWSKWVNLIGLPLVGLFFYLAWDTLRQPYIGAAIINEQGKLYIVALYGSAILVTIGVALGNYLNTLRVGGKTA